MHRGYATIGVLYGALSLPGWILLVAGKLFETRNPYLLFSLLGLPLGALFLGFAADRPPRNPKSGIAVRIAGIAQVFLGFMLLSWLGARPGGVEPLMTSVLFCAMIASYLSLLALVFAILALLAGRPPAPSDS